MLRLKQVHLNAYNTYYNSEYLLKNTIKDE